MLKVIFPVSFRHLPISILIIGFFYLLTPVWSYLVTVLFNLEDVSFFDFRQVLSSFSGLSISLIALGSLLGFGILGVKRWGYFLFLGFNIALIFDAIYRIIKYGIGLEGELLSNFFLTIFYFILIFYFLNQEISTPYLTLVPRGFRKKWRIEIPLSGEVIIDGKKSLKLTTMDVSPSGCLAKVSGEVPEEASISIRLDLDNRFEVPAILIRREEEGDSISHGFRFQYDPNDPRKKQLKKFLSTKLLPRFSITSPVTVFYGENKFSGEVLNVSEGGFYLASNQKLKSGDEINFELKLLGYLFKGIGKISWENQTASYNKPEGYGVKFSSLQSSILYKLFLFLFEKKSDLNFRDR
ncbi:MAG: PilZ domain-containing protein [Leptospiraceae bacterium]|nr:PilZ domain-containing protein [Leptospiraceae bacterium]